MLSSLVIPSQEDFFCCCRSRSYLFPAPRIAYRKTGSSGNKSSSSSSIGGRKSTGSRDDLLAEEACRRLASQDAAKAPDAASTRRRLTSSISLGSFHIPLQQQQQNQQQQPPQPPPRAASSSRYSKLRAKSKSFFRKEPRANSADTRCPPLNKRHSSHEPLYANGEYTTPIIGSKDADLSEEPYSSGQRTPIYRTQSKFLDSDYLIEEIARSYKPSGAGVAGYGSNQRRLSGSISMGNVSRSVFDLRNPSSSLIAGSSSSHLASREASYAKTVGSRGSVAGEVATLEGKKRMVPLRKLLSCDSSAKMRSQSICVPRSLPLDPTAKGRGVSGSSYRLAPPDSPAVGETSGIASLLHRHSASIPTTPATTSAPCKPIAKQLLDVLSQRLREEAIDLTTDPYSDAGGFCGIPAALVQRYADETSHDVYDVADALDHLRLEQLLRQGRRGVSAPFLPLSSLFVSLFPSVRFMFPSCVFFSSRPLVSSRSTPLHLPLLPLPPSISRLFFRLVSAPVYEQRFAFLLLLLSSLSISSRVLAQLSLPPRDARSNAAPFERERREQRARGREGDEGKGASSQGKQRLLV